MEYKIKITPNATGNPPGKLADAELYFDEGPLAGLKLIGFSVWSRRDGSRNIMFPSRQYSVDGERRSFALLRPVEDPAAQDRLRESILEAYAKHGLFVTRAALKTSLGSTLHDSIEPLLTS